jgi:hypothetical protein
MTLEKRIDFICEHMPDDWSALIKLEKGSGFVVVVRPDETEIPMDSGTIEEQLLDAYHYALEETEAEKIRNEK